MTEIVYQKQCGCEPATASGPRVVHDEEPGEDAVRVRFTYCRMACDECDTPWRRVGRNAEEDQP